MPKKPTDPFSAHEALDPTHVVATTFNDFIFEHPVVESAPSLRRKAAAIGDALGELYQAVGRGQSYNRKSWMTGN